MKKNYSLVAKYVVSLMVICFESRSQQISCGDFHGLFSCNGQLKIWGSNSYGLLGNGTTVDDSNLPVTVSLSNFIAFDGANGHNLAIKSDSTVWAWGYNFNNTLGNGTNVHSNLPVQTLNLNSIKSISGGGNFSLALKSDGTVWSWGDNSSNKQLGYETNGNSSAATIIPGLNNIKSISAGFEHSLALKEDGTVLAWGYNGDGQLANGTLNVCGPVAQINNFFNVKQVAAGSFHSMALMEDSTVWAWGYNHFGQLGNGSNINWNPDPVQVNNLTGIVRITGGYHHSLALKSDGTVWAWGWNNYGQLGTGDTNTINVPVQISSLSGIVSIDAGRYHSCALKNDGSIWCWGKNDAGQLGIGNYNNSNTPVQVIEVCNVTQVNETYKEKDFDVFPNPSSGHISINFNNFLNSTFCLYDVLGNCVIDKTKLQNKSQTIDLSNQPKGIYFVEVVKNNQRAVKKISLQ